VISPGEERKARVGRICRKVRFLAWNEGVRCDGIVIIISMNVSLLFFGSTRVHIPNGTSTVQPFS